MSRDARRLLGLTAAFVVALMGCGGESPGEGGSSGQPSTASAMEPMEAQTGTVVVDGLNGPMGVMVDGSGNVWVVDSGVGGDQTMVFPSIADGTPTDMSFGNTSRLIRVSPDGTESELAHFPSVAYPEGPEGANRVAMLNETVYVSSGGWSDGMQVDRVPFMASISRFEEGKMTEIANTWDLERTQNPAGALVETHAYGLAGGSDGMLWMADAAGNDLLKVDPATGDVELVAVFDAMPGPIPNPNRGGAKEIEPVPTSVAFDDDGNIYVSLLSGVPFLPEMSKVVQVTQDGVVSDYSTGLTMLTDLKTAPDGHLYAVSIGVFTEEGPQPNSGSVLRIGEGTAETVISGLSNPTALAFDSAGNAYVTTNGLGVPGSGEVLRFDGVGSPM